MAYPIARFRERFNIAADVNDSDITAAFYEADRLDMKAQIDGIAYQAVPAKYIPDTDDYTGAETVICYYAFARYQQTADQKSTATGLKLQTYNGSIIVPDSDKNKRYEAMRGKADLFIKDLIEVMGKDGLLKGCNKSNTSRICLIK